MWRGRRAELPLGTEAELSASTGLHLLIATGCGRHDPLCMQGFRVHGDDGPTDGTSRSQVSSTDVPSD
jgi:hypothetical protein